MRRIRFFNRRRSEEDEFYHLREVVYRRPGAVRTLGNLTAQDVFLSKAPSWSYEREMRMLAPLRDADNCIDSPNGKIFLFSLPPRCVRRVVVGARTSVGFRVEIGALLTSGPYQHVELCFAKLDHRTRGIEISC